MAPVFSNEKPPVTRERIAELEKKLKVRLPHEYVSLLLAHNGGRVKPNVFTITGSPRGDKGIVNRLFPVGDGEADDLEAVVKRHRRRLPKDLFPVGNDPGGDLICIGLEGERYGQVLLWDRTAEAADGETPGYENVYFLAKSLGEFLDGLRPHGV